MEKLVFEGNGRRIILEDDKILIQKKGAMGAVNQLSDAVIPMRTLQTVAFKKGNAFVNGYIQFGTLGGQAKNNTVWFFLGQNAEAEKFKNAVEERMEAYHRAQAQGNTTVIQQLSPADEVKKYKELLDSGIITQAEFDAKKKQLLGL